MNKPFVLIAVGSCLLSMPAQAMSLRQIYENCVGTAYFDFVVKGERDSPETAERAFASCQTEAHQLESALLNADMEPKVVFSVITNIKVGLKRRLLAK